MKKIKLLLVAAMVAGLVTGCSKFKPDQTGISVKKNGSIVSVIKESLDRSYYDPEELERMIDETVDSYNASAGAKYVKVDQYEVENGQATLQISYDSAADYQKMNQVEFYLGDLASAYGTEYGLEGSFFKVEKGERTDEALGKEAVLATKNYNVIVLEEELLVEVPGDIVFVSSNVEMLGKRQVITGQEAPQTTAEVQVNDSGIPVINPEVMEGSPMEEQEDGTHLFYIIYK
ncbi:MAG: hypothetical protein SO016_13820 [Lachnospiraceae bacterium]|nr:hypothetical protein [Robinsoniella sp.]MDY3767744.1 hypothetical protein [Lachnospiraceae bacterium]